MKAAAAVGRLLRERANIVPTFRGPKLELELELSRGRSRRQRRESIPLARAAIDAN
jgi:hypothetical protein